MPYRTKKSRFAFRTCLSLLTLTSIAVVLWAVGHHLGLDKAVQNVFRFDGSKPLLWLNIMSDSLISLACYVITGSLIWFIHRSDQDAPFNWAVLAFSGFFLFNGLTRTAAVFTFVWPRYLAVTVLKSMYAIFGVAVAAAATQLMPEVIQYIKAGKLKLEASECENKRAQEALIAQEKLAAIGKLSAIIAHETNNPLDALGNSIYLLSQLAKGSQNAEMAGYIEVAKAELDKVLEVMQRTLRFQRESPVPVRTDMTKIVDDAVNLHNHKMKKRGIRVTKRYHTVPPVLVFPGEMRQVFSNLISNAIDACNGGGVESEIRIGVKYAVDPNDGQQGVKVAVYDNGCGIPMDMQARLFTPFATSKGIDGSGIGLWVTNEIIKKHKGYITYRTGKRGTIFNIFIPTGLPEQSMTPPPVVMPESLSA